MLIRGIQIAYIPMHAKSDVKHPDVQFGFVTSVRGDVAFCRYWSKYNPGELRTKANSEATPIDMLVECESTRQVYVEAELYTIANHERLASKGH